MRERVWYFLFKWLWGPDDQIMEIETPCPESPGQWPEYPGVTVKIFRCYDSKKKDVIVVVSPVPESGA